MLGLARTVAGGYSRSFSVRCGVQQGCPASNLLFNLFINHVLKEVLSAAGHSGVKICYRLDGQPRQGRKSASIWSMH